MKTTSLFLVALFMLCFASYSQNSSLKQALSNSDTLAALQLFKSGVNPNQLDGDASLLITYCRYAEADPMAFFLLRHGAKPDTLRSPSGRTALHVAAAYYACESLCDALLSAGAYVNALTNDGATPLMLAALSAKLRLVNFLLQHGANPKLKDKKGQTAYDYALKADPLTDLPEFKQKMQESCGWDKAATVARLKELMH